eukprot:TRINITY_DN17036_c0_g1_i1.p1 TRINITY_DN17036_c0_g1~~TRINITY_DN17036_c0_g1_i1.p1  ORF type:complete len:443 (+),score=124.66 TRINITY_DN17036_c0_g1_i1:89-1417(+)
MDEYEEVAVLGMGSFGRVARIRRKRDGRQLVWKELDYGKMNDKQKQLIVSEVNILRSFRDPYIVRYHDRIIDRESHRIFIIMEYCDHGDLAALIRRHRRSGTRCEEKLVWRVFLQLLLALSQCHNRKEGRVLHRDIKPANVFLDRDNNVKLGDFGLARTLSDSQFAHTNVGTPYYMSPELTDGGAYDDKSDVWALGCVVYELCSLEPPFAASSQLALAVKIREGRYRPLSDSYSPELAEAVGHCLTVDARRRYSVQQLLALPSLAVRLRDKQLSNKYLELRSRDSELQSQAAELAKATEALRAREAAVEERERQLAEMQSELRSRAAALARREAELATRCPNCAARPLEAELTPPSAGVREVSPSPPLRRWAQPRGSDGSGSSEPVRCSPRSPAEPLAAAPPPRAAAHPHRSGSSSRRRGPSGPYRPLGSPGLAPYLVPSAP